MDGTDVSLTDVLKLGKKMETALFYIKLDNTTIYMMAAYSHETSISLFISQHNTRPCFM
jgi:hypothetical protein